MADTKITDLGALTEATLATGDLFTAVDISDTSLAATGTNKKITATATRSALAAFDGRAQLDKAW